MSLNRRASFSLAFAAAFCALAGPAISQDAAGRTLIRNVSNFVGASKTLITGTDVVLSGNKISKIVAEDGGTSGYDTLIDGKELGHLTHGLIVILPVSSHEKS